MHNRWKTAVMMAAALVLAACGGSAAPAPEMNQMPGTSAAATSAPASSAARAVDGDVGTGGSAPASPADNSAQPQAGGFDRMVVKNASMAVQVLDVRAVDIALRARIVGLGGYIVTTETYGSEDEMSMAITFRVPVAQFEAALEGVNGLAEEVISRNISGQDVTAEYVDLESRVRNLELTRDRLQDLLQKATRIEDALNVNNALTDVQGQIEQIRGQMQYLKANAAMSTVAVQIQPVPPTLIVVAEQGWQPGEVAERALAGLIGFGQGLAEQLIALAIWLPVWLPLVVLGRWGWVVLNRRIGAKPVTVKNESTAG